MGIAASIKIEKICHCFISFSFRDISNLEVVTNAVKSHTSLLRDPANGMSKGIPRKDYTVPDYAEIAVLLSTVCFGLFQKRDIQRFSVAPLR